MTFVVHMVTNEQEKMPVDFKKQTQTQNKAQVGSLIFDESSTVVSA